MNSYKIYDLIKVPLITEKTTSLSEKNKYAFYVSKDAKKTSVKAAIELIFQVKVKKVNIINVSGKIKKFKGRLGKQSDRKKAIVSLEKDCSIDFSSGGK